MRWITPQAGDPTYSLLKAHLLFEELLNAYLARSLSHVSALQGARLTFTQTLAVARASSRHIEPDHWVWKAIADLNRIRNSLSHEAQPKDLQKKIANYVDFVVANTKRPLPEPALRVGPGDMPNANQGHHFTAADMVTIGLYYTTASLMGFSVKEIEKAGGVANAG